MGGTLSLCRSAFSVQWCGVCFMRWNPEVRLSWGQLAQGALVFSCTAKIRCTIRRLAAVAQLDRVLGYEPRGRGFDSCQPHHMSSPETAKFQGFSVSGKPYLAVYSTPHEQGVYQRA